MERKIQSVHKFVMEGGERLPGKGYPPNKHNQQCQKSFNVTHTNSPSCVASDPSPTGTSSSGSPPAQLESSHRHHSYPEREKWALINIIDQCRSYIHVSMSSGEGKGRGGGREGGREGEREKWWGISHLCINYTKLRSCFYHTITYPIVL